MKLFAGSVLPKILGLLVDLFIDLVPINWRIAVIGKHENQVDFQFGLDVAALTPIRVLYFVIDDQLDGFR